MLQKQNVRKGNEQKTGREWLQFAGAYTLAFGVIAALMLWIFLSQGKTFMRMVDGIGQHFASVCYVRDYIREFFRTGALPMVDFSVGQGFDVIGTLNYYGFGDPLLLLTALFPDGAQEQMYAFLIILRLYLSGLAFSGFCYTIGKKQKQFVIAGSLLYAFCNFALYAGVTHPCFLNGVMYLPLLLLGIERIVQKKGILPLALTVAGSFMSNYYFMYMNTVLAGIYLLIRLGGHYRKLGVKGFSRIVGKIVLSYVWGVCLSAVILLPAVYAFLTNGRTGSESQSISLFYDMGYYARIWKGLTESYGGGTSWSAPGAGAVGIVSLMILLVLRNRKERRLLLGFAVLMAMLCVPAAGSVMNGFSYVSNRWSYGMGFLLALISVFALEHLREMEKREITRALALTAFYTVPLIAVWIFFWHSREMFFNIMAVIATGAGLFAVWRLLRSRKKEVFLWAVTGVTAAGIMCNMVNLYGKSFKNYPKEYLKHGRPTEKLKDSSLSALSLVEDDYSFYRTERHWDILNQALVEGVNATNYYYSVVPGSMTELYKSVWLNALERVYVLNSLDSRTALTALASVKYYTSDSETSVPYGYEKAGEIKGKSGKVHYLYENMNPLPLGYTYDQVMLREDYEKLDPLRREQTLLASAVVEEPVGEIDAVSEGADTRIVKKEVSVKSTHKVKVKDGKLQVKKGGTLTLSFEGEPNSETCLVLSGIGAEDELRDSTSVSSSSAQTRMKVTGEQQHNYFGKEGEILNLGYSQNAQTECTLKFSADRTFYLDEIFVQCVSMEGMDERISERKKESLEDIQMGTNRFSGKISVSDSKVMQLSVPYSRGWKIYVDGEETETFPSSIAYTGVVLEEGEHEILAVYTSPWILPGAVLTCGGAAAVVLYLISGKRKRGEGR